MKHPAAKRTLALLLVISLSLFLPLNALAQEINILFFSTTYLMWADLFGVTYLSTDSESIPQDDDTSALLVDTLALYINKKEFEFEKAVLFYKHEGYTDLEMDLRALAFFAAVEYGMPDDLSTEIVRTVRVASMKMLKQMKDTIALPENAAALKQGKIIPFYVGEKYIYSFMQFPDGTRQVIILE